MEAYLDNAATTKPSPMVKEQMLKTLCTDYGNPSSLHQKGLEAEHYLKEARQVIADSMKTRPSNIIFTSGGTESNNMALIGGALARKRRGNHIITTKIEHPSVHNPVLFLESQGYRATFLKVDRLGHVDLSELKEALCEDTILVSVMHVNNEMGAVEDLEAIADLVKSYNREILFHVDDIQGYGKYRIYPERTGIDLLSVSGHKIHGPKGIGFLYQADGTNILPILYGGGQQKGMRSGTENVPGIAGLSQAVKEIYENHEEKRKTLYERKWQMIERLLRMDQVTVHGVREDGQNITMDDVKKTAPHIVSAGFTGVRSEVLLHALEEKGVYVSSGSACSSNHPQLSGTLKAIGVEDSLLDSTLRFSFSVNTTKEEIDYACDRIEDLLPLLKRFTRR
ncbi:MAG: cysteine desulfurase family protein [Clostridiales bacterium]|nr:cysteine desulfurase family protein [Clostridiales bacterium]